MIAFWPLATGTIRQVPEVGAAELLGTQANAAVCIVREVNSGNMKFIGRSGLPRDNKRALCEILKLAKRLGVFPLSRISSHHIRHNHSIIYFTTKGSISEVSKRGTLASPSSFQPTMPHSSPVPTWNIIFCPSTTLS